jgi:hypothetical protein
LVMILNCLGILTPYQFETCLVIIRCRIVTYNYTGPTFKKEVHKWRNRGSRYHLPARTLSIGKQTGNSKYSSNRKLDIGLMCLTLYIQEPPIKDT